MRRNGIEGARLAAVGAAMATVLAVAACQGTNLFSLQGQGGAGAAGADTAAPSVSIQSPHSLSAVPVGDSVLVQAKLTDNVGVRTVRMYGFDVRGSQTLGTDTVAQRFVEKDVTLPAGISDTILTRYLQPTADSTRDTVSIVVAASDSSGNTGADTVQLIVGGPTVQFLGMTDGQKVQAGLNLTLRLQAVDPSGVNRVGVSLTGAVTDSIVENLNPSADSVVLDTVVAIPSAARGAIEVTGTAVNSRGIVGQNGPLTLNVVAGGGGDTIPPHLQETASAPSLMELGDSVLVQATGADNLQGTGVVRVGYTVLAISVRRADTLMETDSATFSPPRTGTVSKSFGFRPFNVDSLGLPDTLDFQVTSWMLDAAGNCAATTSTDTASLACGTYKGARVAAGHPGLNVQRTIVDGQTVQLPSGGQIMDAVVDTTPGRRKLYLSNITNNRVDVFDLTTDQFDPSIGVGSEPWGLAFSRGGDSLWVANSGGANFDIINVPLGQDMPSERFETPSVHVFNIQRTQGTTGSVEFLVTALPQATAPSFSDLPEFVAVDKFGNLVFSTKTTSVGNLGTARKAYYQTGWVTPEAKLFVEQNKNSTATDNWAVAHIDSIAQVDTVVPGGTGGLDTLAIPEFFDHEPGFPNQIIKTELRLTDPDPICDATARLVAQGSDAYCEASAQWNIPSITFQDTTYVAASGNGDWVSIGEGGASPDGRVMTYEAHQRDTTALTSWLTVSDFLRNAPDEIHGLALNYDGTLGVVRGGLAAYFISPQSLHLEGQTAIPDATIGGGAALDPLSADAPTYDNPGGKYEPDTQLAFVPTGDHTVDVIDTYHFTVIGQVYIRDIITGPLRAVLPFPSDNAGLTCGTIPVYDRYGTFIGNAIQLYNGGNFNSPIPPNGSTDDRCVVVKLFAPTSSGGVVVINVRKGDILRDHPDR